MSLLAELKRRNVFRVGAAYLILGWLLVQVASVFAPALLLPDWVVRLVAFILILGFPLALLLAWAFELTPEGVRRTETVPVSQSITQRTGQKLNYVIIGALVLALGLVVIDSYVLTEEPSAPVVVADAGSRIDAGDAVPGDAGSNSRASADLAGSDAAANSGTRAGGQAGPPQPAGSAAENQAGAVARQVLPNSVAVLPFENRSPRAEDAYFADGIHQEIHYYLSKLRALTVINRASMLQYADLGERSIADVARELNVEAVMQGNVRFAGSEVRINVELIDPMTGAVRWGGVYQNQLDDIFQIQADIAMNVANELEAEFSSTEQAAIEAAPTSEPAAYALYLQAQNMWDTAENPDLDAMQALLDRALAIDPTFARAYGLKAEFYARTLTNNVAGSGVSGALRAARIRQIQELAGRALAIDPEEDYARRALRENLVSDWRWSEYRAALEPDDLESLDGANLWVISWMGDVAEAVRVARRIVEISPNSPFLHLQLGVALAYAGNRSEADAAFRESLRIAPALALNHHWLAFNAVATGGTSRALDELRLVEQLLGDSREVVYLPELAYAYSLLGQTDDVARVHAELEALGDEEALGVGTWAMAELAIGNEARALELLEQAAEKARNHEPDLGFLHLMNLRMNALGDPRLEEPRFADVLERIRGD